MPTGVLVPNDYDDVAAFAARAETLEYDSFWTGELWGRDAFVALTRAAEATDRIDLGTAITNVYGRSPATIAQAGATLDEASDGRARLGLGTSTEKAVEDLHGVSFERPARRMHEATELTKRFLDGDGRVAATGSTREVLTDTALLTDCDLRPPQVVRLFDDLTDDPPLTVEAARDRLAADDI